uniref:Uncharacterized protein n=1 Tax=Rhizophora mucronata TaxID=61149 RepID=A0A2P2N3X3_RHIMU
MCCSSISVHECVLVD